MSFINPQFWHNPAYEESKGDIPACSMQYPNCTAENSA